MTSSPNRPPAVAIATRVPRWPAAGPADPSPTTAEAAIPDELWQRLHATANRRGLDDHALVVAAHLGVLAAIASDPAPVAGVVSAAGRRLVRARVAGQGWAELAAHLAELPRRNGAESELDIAPSPAHDDGSAVLRVRIAAGTLRLRSRAGLLSAEALDRIAGYHLRALHLVAADGTDAWRAVDLLSPNEITHQVVNMAGSREPLGEAMFVELFTERARRHPDRVAVSHRGHSWTYRQLDEHSAEIAAALREAGAAAEEIVAVLAERDLQWAAAVIGVLRAGCAYLPVDPATPARRICAVLAQAGCRLVLTARAAGSAARGGGRRVLDIAGLLGTGRTADPAPVAPNALAYVYFTSGSTGTPKGVMCEHAGLLNHLLAKVSDMDIGAGDVVAQTASACFDISLWQLLAPQLAGGSSRIVDTSVLLDVDAFRAELAASGARVVQLVPSYFQELVSRLEQRPGGLGRVRSVSVTGEELPADLVRRWFACCPGVRLVNAYGATELCDDTVHGVMTGPPDTDPVPLGRSLRNVDSYVLAEDLSLLPLGAPGQIAFSGVCVGRGYLGDEEQTAAAFVADPHRPGQRLYRTGDLGRWLPGGRLQFLGRRDEQVRIRGARVEIREVEAGLGAVPGVSSAAVVLDGGPDRASILVAFVTGTGDLDAGSVRAHLAARLPDQLVPTYVHKLHRLPLTANGKVDKATLATLAGALGHADGRYVAPVTPTERQLATAWAEVLHVPLERIGRADDFFRLGGTSLAVVRLQVRLDGRVSLRQILAHPVLSDLAAALDGEHPAPDPRLLQPLSTPDDSRAVLVCFPHAGGNSVNFQLLAGALEPHRIAVLGVELPGHDLDTGPTRLSTVEEVAAAVHAELRAHRGPPILLWGHSTGAAPALATGRRLEADAFDLRGVFLGAILPATDDELRAESDRVLTLADGDLVAEMLADSGYVEVGGLRAERTRVVGPAYRHDVRTATDFFRHARGRPGGQLVGARVHVVIAADDPHTKGRAHPLPGWPGIAARVRLHELPEGGHYFPTTRPEDVAALVAAAQPLPDPPPRAPRSPT